MDSDRALLLFQVLYPLLLIPGLIWIGYRYLPLLAGGGRLRLYLLMAVSGGMLAVQAGGVSTEAYPLTTWRMYGERDPSPTTWRFLAVGPEGERPFPWDEVAPVRAPRGFQRQMVALADQLEDEETGSSEAAEARATLRSHLERLLAIYNGRGGNARDGGGASGRDGPPGMDEVRARAGERDRTGARPGGPFFEAVHVERCEVDHRDFPGRAELECERLLTVRAEGAGRAP